MELRRLRYFVAVAETGSVSRAAIQLGIAQPPLGQQLRLLEAELGVTLFDRTARRLVLSAAGRAFLEDARRLLADAAEAVAHVRRFDRGEEGLLTLGFTSSASLHHLTPRLIRRFCREYPGVQIAVEESETYALILALQQRRIDVAFMRIAALPTAPLLSVALDEEEIVAAIPADHPLAHAIAPLTLAVLARHRIVSYQRPDGPGIFDDILKAAAGLGLVLDITLTVHRLMAALNLVAAGLGVTLVPANMRVLHADAIIYRSLAPGTLPSLPLFVIHRSDERLKLVRNFIEIAIQPSL